MSPRPAGPMSGGADAAFDVVVVGAGNAALCAALSAREQGADVAVLEKAPRPAQGGNCPYTGGGFRFVHDGLVGLRGLLPDLSDADAARLTIEPYTAQQFLDHLLTVTRGETDEDLADVIVSQSRSTVEWMQSVGVRWQLPDAARRGERAPSTIPGSVALSAEDSGPGLVRMLTTSAERAGVPILYETAMESVVTNSEGAVCGVVARDADGSHEIRSRGVVLACGGFEASAEMRGEHLGRGWEGARVRGSEHNTGDGHRAAMAVGAVPYGQWEGCHGTPIDVAAPATGDLAVTDSMPRRSYTLGIMVDRDGRRFADEGEGFAEQTFTAVAHLVMRQPGGVVYQVFDGRSAPLLEDRYRSSQGVKANSVVDLAQALGLDADTLSATVESFNAGAHEGEYHPRLLDGLSTTALDPPKSNWAIRLDTPPFVAYQVTGGITYTYGGLKIDRQARVLDGDDRPIQGLFAAGEIVGGIFYHNSLRAAGLMHGSVFGRLAGAGAAGRLA